MADEKKSKKMSKPKQIVVGLLLGGAAIFVLHTVNGGNDPTPPAASSATAVPAEPAPAPKPLPPSEAALIQAVDQARQTYAAGANDMAKGAARPERAKAVCALMHSRDVAGWRGTVDTLSTNGDGKGILSVRLARHVTVSTTNNDLSDSIEPTLIAPGTPLFQEAAALHVGQAVVFSGHFFASTTDCLEEDSMTLEGSIDDPDYSFRFASIRPAK